MAQYPMPPQYQPPQRKGLPPQILWLFVAVCVVGLIVLSLVYFMIPEPQKPIDFQVSAQSASVLQGGALVIQQSLSPDDVTTEVSYKVEHLITKQIIADKSETLDPGRTLPATTQIDIPSDSQPGRYVLDAAVKRNSRSTKSSFVFQINLKQDERVRKPTRETRELPKECPVECNDYNACTTDRCVDGVCRFDAFTPCCGNNVCESGETAQSCPEDCQEKGLQKQEAVDTLIDRAKRTTTSQGATLCQSMSSVDDADTCYAEVALDAGTYTLCNNIVDTTTKDTCLIDVAIEHDQFVACDEVEDRWLQNSCFAYARLKEVEA